jgi:hypothetical protein
MNMKGPHVPDKSAKDRAVGASAGGARAPASCIFTTTVGDGFEGGLGTKGLTSATGCNVVSRHLRSRGGPCTGTAPYTRKLKSETMDLGLLTYAIANRGREAVGWTGWIGGISPARQTLESAYKTCANF